MNSHQSPFEIAVPDSDLADLIERLSRTRWPEPETVTDWSQGVPLAYLRNLCEYWSTEYDWREREDGLNRFPQFRTTIDGLGIHFVHVRSPVPGALPIVITHGWPGSFVEFLAVIGPLTDPSAFGGDPADAFHVVCPSLPGYAFSDKPTSTGWDVDRIARAWAQLMKNLGYSRYGAQGGDWGSAVTSRLGALDVPQVVGIHLNMLSVGTDRGSENLTQAEIDALEAMKYYTEWDSGYAKEQSTRPQTIGYSLVDSPVGLCAWILEKFWSWTDTDGDPVGVLGADRILDNVMLYWLTGTGASAGRLYWEAFRNRHAEKIEVPTGVSIYPKEIFRPSRRWAERRYSNIVQWEVLPRGGHFAAFEQPNLFVDQVRKFFRIVRE
jgi:pimeloyl-ACP methyl ester carboxylesterase